MAHSLPTVPETPREPSDPQDWRNQLKRSVTTLEQLEAHLELSDAERVGVHRALAEGFPMAITPHYLALCDPTDPDCPIRKQCIPVDEEASEVPGDMRDPLGEEAHEPAPHLIQRYPDRALLLVTDRCALYCRFCTRSRMVGAGGGVRPMEALEPALRYVQAHPHIRDLIISGGDPLVMSDGRLLRLLERVATIESVDTVRLATRAPVTLPQRITPELCAVLRRHPATWVMTHFNHPRELNPASRLALARLADAGLPVMNQTVLLRGINDDPQVLTQLFRGLVKNRVRPYYLLQADPVRGTGHLRTPLSTGMAIMEALQGKLSGIALPKFIVDTPGGLGKVPVSPNYIVEREGPRTRFRTFRGELVDYLDPP